MKYEVISTSSEWGTDILDQPMWGWSGVIRRERIDTEENEMFKGCWTPEDVRAAYEAFWNLSDEHPRVVVLDVRRLSYEGALDLGIQRLALGKWGDF